MLNLPQGDSGEVSGLRKWWRRNREKIIGGILGMAIGGPVGMLVGAAASAYLFGEDGIFARTYDIPLTLEEETKLDIFVEGKFLPFYKSLIQLLDGSIVSPAARSTIQDNPVITNVNQLRKQIAILKKWLAVTTFNLPAGYSNNMVQARNAFVNEQLDILENSIAQYLTSKNVTALPTKQTVYVDQETETFGMNYRWSRSGITTYYAKLSASEIFEDLSSDPVEVIIPDVVIETIETATEVATATANKKMPLLYKAVGVGVLVLIAKKLFKK